MKAPILVLLTSLTLGTMSASAQQASNSDTSRLVKKVQAPYKIRRLYTGSSFDFAILSTSIEQSGDRSNLNTPRFTAFTNWGINVHFDMSRYFGIYSGAGIRNIGYIEKSGDLTIKRRVYSLGIPLGVKLGDLRNRNFYFGGVGIDLPFNYREKVFEKRGDKEKFNEWFSDRTPKVMPFVFAGYSMDPGIILKLQYYPGNFLNQDYTEEALHMPPAPYRPYSDKKVNLILLSLGIDIHYAQYKIQEREYWEWRKAREQERMTP